MAQMIPVGPYRTLKSIEGAALPYYIIPFDKDGRCEGPMTQQHLLDHAAQYSDIFLFSHGWNNDWSAATKRYENFINGFQQQRQQFALKMPDGYKPLLAGIFWPSQAMEWFDSETGPDIAAADPAAQDAAVDVFKDLMREIAVDIPPAQRERFFQLVQTESLDEIQAAELAGMLATLLTPDDEGMRADAPSADDLLTAAGTLAATEPSFDQVGTATGEVQTPEAALGLGDIVAALNPRNLLKPFTVWRMKDRAGKVGVNGVATLLKNLLIGSNARLHLIGHSFGCKVVMTGACSLPKGVRKINSVLLLQPAVSQFAFARNVPERGVPGGFARALDQVVAPIVSTFSANDVALTKMFHIALRRHDDLGELQPAPAGDEPPSKYCALGGFGPQASDATLMDIMAPNQRYTFGPGGRIVGVRGTRAISGHGDVSNPSTWWLAYSTVTSSMQ